MARFTCGDKSVLNGLPLGPIMHETDTGFVFRWPHVGTSPSTFTASDWWFHTQKPGCDLSETRVSFSEHLLGCPKCGTLSHSLVTMEIRTPKLEVITAVPSSLTI